MTRRIYDIFNNIYLNKFRFYIVLFMMTIGVFSLTSVRIISRLAKQLIYREIQTFGINRIWIYRDFNTDANNAFTNSIIDEKQLNLKHAKQLMKYCPNITQIAPSIYVAMDIRYQDKLMQGVRTIATIPEWISIKNEEIAFGRFLSPLDELCSNYVCVLSFETYASLFGNSIALPKQILIDGEYFTIVGVLKKKERPLLNMIGAVPMREELIVIPLSVMQSSRWKNTVDIQYLDLQVSSETYINLTIDQIKDYLDLCFGENKIFEIKTLSGEIEKADRIMKILTFSLTMIAAVVLLLAGLGIMNIMLTAVNERYFEIGIRRAVGARKADILFQFLAESFAVGIIGGFLGIAGSLVVYYLALIFLGKTQISLIEPVITAVIVSMSVGLLAGVYPAKEAADLNPIDALRNAN
ncbi:MAG: FtsX-like permease family protein [Candidatus Lokiarchaeota archaeon]|nr:FtsX-like permease family protein [Candidatus Lokiarchaeota archaeon]